MQKQYRRKPLEKLVGALLLDKVFRDSFLQNPEMRPQVVSGYNASYKRRFGEALIALTSSEESLIMSLPTNTLQNFCDALETVLDADENQTYYQVPARLSGITAA